MCVNLRFRCSVSVYCLFGIIFFFQAEDGIRDLVRSRGLGDVYKRQEHAKRLAKFVGLVGATDANLKHAAEGENYEWTSTVSYTHLTLPTIYSV